MGCDDSDVEVGDQQGYGGVFVSSADADVVESAVVADGDGACFVDAVVSDSEVGRVACLARFGFWGAGCRRRLVWCVRGCGGAGCGCSGG